MNPTISDFARAFGLDRKQEADTHVWGTVKAINSDGSYQVALNASGTTTTCTPCVSASVGTRVLVLITKDGKAVAMNKRI